MTKESAERYLMNEVRKLYRQNHSLQKTAEEMGTAYGKIRKILITMGEYQTPFSKRVLELKESGLTIAEIAEKEKCSKNKVAAYLPYEKGVYNAPEQTLDATKSKCYRRRIEVAMRNQVTRKSTSSQGDNYEKRGESRMGKTKKVGKKNVYPVHLHLELYNEHLSDEEIQILMKYADATERGTLTRDILIPSDMPLHNLHYTIQRLFGWQNSHLRSFRLPDRDYERLTEGSVKGWADLVGVLFKGMPEDEGDQFWDDDYSGGSFKTWLRKKYTGPYHFGGYTEDYDTAQSSVHDFIKRFPKVDVQESFHDYYKREKERKNGEIGPKVLKKAAILDLTLEELHNSIIIEEGTDILHERLEVISVLGLPEESLADAKALGKSFAVPAYEKNHGVNYMDEQPVVFPVAHKLIYNYDFGDNWLVEISRRKNCRDVLRTGELTEEALSKVEQAVIENHKPVCISKKGAFVMDDVGGMHGYAEFLLTIFESDDLDEKRSLRTWAESLGWSRRNTAIDKML